MNKVILIGNVGSDPEIKALPGGTKVAEFSLATNERWTDKKTGEKEKRTEWHKLKVFGDGLVGVCERYVEKGKQICVQGSIQSRSYEKDGEKRYITEIKVSDLELLGKKED